MEDENYRNLVLGRLKASERKLTDEDRFVEDVVSVSRVFFGYFFFPFPLPTID